MIIDQATGVAQVILPPDNARSSGHATVIHFQPNLVQAAAVDKLDEALIEVTYNMRDH